MKLAATVRKDMTPQSPDHWVRIILGGLSVAAACYKYVTHSGPWARDDIIAAALFLLAGFGVVFTRSIVSLFQSVPVPWRKDSGPPPPAEAA